MFDYIKQLLFGKSGYQIALDNLEESYRQQRYIETHWITRNCFILDPLGCGALPVYEIENEFFSVILNEINERCYPGTVGYRHRAWVPLISVSKLHNNFEENSISALHFAGTLDNRKYKTLEDIEYYYESELHYNNPFLKINTLIAPLDGSLRQMADDFAATHNDVKVFYSEFCNHKRSAGRMMNFIIALPSCEFVGRMPTRGDEYGVLVSEIKNICVIQ